jgi:hypothetical protein
VIWTPLRTGLEQTDRQGETGGNYQVYGILRVEGPYLEQWQTEASWLQAMSGMQVIFPSHRQHQCKKKFYNPYI